MRTPHRLFRTLSALLRRWGGEPLAYSAILFVGLTAFLLHLFLWVIPQLNTEQELPSPQTLEFWSGIVWGWLTSVFWFALIVLGFSGLFLSLRTGAVSPERKAAKVNKTLRFPDGADYPTVPDCMLINESPGTHLAYRLPLAVMPIFPVVGLTLFAAAWNLTAWGVMMHRFWNPAEQYLDQLFALIVCGMFSVLGILMLADVFRRILFTFSVGPAILEISDHPVYPGRKYRVLLQQAGVLRFRSLCVDVVCEETARFRQGTDTITNRKTVYRQQLFLREDFETSAGQPLQEEFFVQLPLEVHHSFRQENNEIIWKMEILACINGREDIRRECPLVVRPVLINDRMMEGGGL